MKTTLRLQPSNTKAPPISRFSPILSPHQSIKVQPEHDQTEREADRLADQALAGSTRAGKHPEGSPNRAAPNPDRFSIGSGQPVEPTLRQDMEHRFGHDFSQVRVHAGSVAAQSARQINALAYTLGSDIVFAENRFAPSSSSGRSLLAHELAHVTQQSSLQPSEAATIRRKANTSPTSQVSNVLLDKLKTGEQGSSEEKLPLTPQVLARQMSRSVTGSRPGSPDDSSRRARQQ